MIFWKIQAAIFQFVFFVIPNRLSSSLVDSHLKLIPRAFFSTILKMGAHLEKTKLISEGVSSVCTRIFSHMPFLKVEKTIYQKWIIRQLANWKVQIGDRVRLMELDTCTWSEFREFEEWPINRWSLGGELVGDEMTGYHRGWLLSRGPRNNNNNNKFICPKYYKEIIPIYKQ